MVVTSRDLLILKMCLEQKFMTLLQISRMFFPESENMFQVPMKRVRILVEAGLLETVKLRVNEKRFYVATAKAVALLKKHNMAGKLRALKSLNDKAWEHDEKLTDVRILFDLQLELKNWIPERVLKQENIGKKVPDGIVWNEQYRFVVELELHLKSKRYYERVFLNMCLKQYPKHDFIYILEKESDKKWLMAQAKAWDQIYFTTLERMENICSKLELVNASDDAIYLDRWCRGGALFPEWWCEPPWEDDLDRESEEIEDEEGEIQEEENDTI